MFAFISRWLMCRKFKPFRTRLEVLQTNMQHHSSPDIRQYYAHTGPARMRLHNLTARSTTLEEPQQTKYVLHLVGQLYSLSKSFPTWFQQASEFDLWPYPKNHRDYYVTLLSQHAMRLEESLSELIGIYNSKNSSNYLLKDFCHPTCDGVLDLFKMECESLNAAKSGDKNAFYPMALSHFEIEMFVVPFELDALERFAGTDYFEAFQNINEIIGVGHFFPNQPGRQELDTGTRTIEALCSMVETAYLRAK